LTAQLAAGLVLLASGAWTDGRADSTAQDPVFTIAVADSTHHPIVQIARLLVDPSLEEAARSGLPLRIRVRVELWKDGWVDNLVASESWTSVLLYEPLGREYIIRPNPGPARALRFPTYDAARASLEREYPLSIRPRRAGRYYYTATLELETFSLSELEELERWLQGELQPAVTGDRSLTGAVGQGAKRLMIRLLRLPTRRLEARSEKFRVS
jgi:hypothetical protein